MVPKSPEANFQVRHLNDIPLVQLPVRLSILEAVAFKETLQRICQQGVPHNRIVLDFSQTIFIDSSGLGALVSNFKVARSHGIDLVLRNLHPPVMAVLTMTSLDEVFTIDSTLEREAVQPEVNGDCKLPTTHPSIRSWLKRSLDIVGALVGLGITTILFVPIAIAIKWDSPGPIFFGQIRCGWMGKRFRMWKFRSMCAEAESLKGKVTNQVKGAFFKNQNDPRVTRVGRFLRRTSLDELPQFWNVLTGEMSLVGTRPPTPDEVDRYEIPAWQRLDVKPGMTGEWQVNGRSKIQNFEEVIHLDLQYQQNWNLKHDVKLILKTLMILFRKNSGAA